MQGKRNVITYRLKKNYRNIIRSAENYHIVSFFGQSLAEIGELKGYRWENMNHFRVNNRILDPECVYIKNRLLPKYLFIQEVVDFTFVESIFHRQKIK